MFYVNVKVDINVFSSAHICLCVSLSCVLFLFGVQFSIQIRMIHHQVMMRGCLTPGLPSSRQHTASRAPLTLIRLRLCRT